MIFKQLVWKSALIILLTVAGLFGVHKLAYGTTTSATVDSVVQQEPRSNRGFARERVVTLTANANSENGCADLRGYAYCTVKYDVSGTINVDLDWNLQSTYDANFVVSEVDDLTADGLRNTLVDGMYLCYDIDSCTTCTLSLVVDCVSNGSQEN